MRTASALTAAGSWKGRTGVSRPSATPGDGRVDARLEGGEPDDQAEHDVDAPCSAPGGAAGRGSRRRPHRAAASHPRRDRRRCSRRRRRGWRRCRRSPPRRAGRRPGARAPRRDGRASAPSANATSVAIGMPQPRAPSPPPMTARKIRAGSTMPPSAANAGSSAARRFESSPTTSSRLTSRPTTRKKIVMRPSLTTSTRSLGDDVVADAQGDLGAPEVGVGVRRRRWPTPGPRSWRPAAPGRPRPPGAGTPGAAAAPAAAPAAGCATRVAGAGAGMIPGSRSITPGRSGLCRERAAVAAGPPPPRAGPRAAARGW